MKSIEIISGGQTGADRAALDFAIHHGLPHSGWCPLGRLAEDGIIPARYALSETSLPDYRQRTEWNVRDSDFTLIFTLALHPRGGSLETIAFARELGRPFLHVSRGLGGDPVSTLRQLFTSRAIPRLNVAGSRESEEPGIYSWVYDTLAEAMGEGAS